MSDVVLRHAFAQRGKNWAIDIERGFASEAHQFEFMRRFAAAAGDGDGIGGHVFKSRSCRAQVIGIREVSCFFDAEPAGANALISERARGELCGTLILLPNSNFDGEAQLLAKTPFLEAGTDEHRFAFTWQNEPDQALAQTPM